MPGNVFNKSPLGRRRFRTEIFQPGTAAGVVDPNADHDTSYLDRMAVLDHSNLMDTTAEHYSKLTVGSVIVYSHLDDIKVS